MTITSATVHHRILRLSKNPLGGPSWRVWFSVFKKRKYYHLFTLAFAARINRVFFRPAAPNSVFSLVETIFFTLPMIFLACS